ncbi:hypothetical protein [Luteolibacter marinus]|uniref:hypothetical protein n=1 Tax=Luteolibacter marinus TaxID=2776705 RepID=UPI001867B930|nr:hypothetical protein [Luteolibacter marinus]
MKTFVIAVVALVLGISGGWGIAQLSWKSRISGHAYVCAEGGTTGGFHHSVWRHQAAGDLLAEDWNWQMIRQEQKGHWMLFVTTAFTLSYLVYRACRVRVNQGAKDYRGHPPSHRPALPR